MKYAVQIVEYQALREYEHCNATHRVRVLVGGRLVSNGIECSSAERADIVQFAMACGIQSTGAQVEMTVVKEKDL